MSLQQPIRSSFENSQEQFYDRYPSIGVSSEPKSDKKQNYDLRFDSREQTFTPINKSLEKYFSFARLRDRRRSQKSKSCVFGKNPVKSTISLITSQSKSNMNDLKNLFMD